MRPDFGRFPGTQNDVEVMASALEAFGFETERLLNPSRHKIIQEFRRLADRTKPEDIVFVHYSGPGGRPFSNTDGVTPALIPSDARADSVEGWITDEQLHGLLVDIPARNKTVAFDAPVTGDLVSLANSSAAYALLAAQTPGYSFSEVSIDDRPFGMLSHRLSELIGGVSGSRLTFADILPLLRVAMAEHDQEPTFAGGLSRQSLKVLGSDPMQSKLDLLLLAEQTVPAVKAAAISRDAVDLSRAGVELPPNLLHSAGVSLLEAGQYEAAASVLKDAAETQDSRIPINAAVALAVARIGAGDFETALDGVRSQVQTLSPSHRESHEPFLTEFLSTVESLVTGPRALLVGIDAGETARSTENLETAKQWLTDVLGLSADGNVQVLMERQCHRRQDKRGVPTIGRGCPLPHGRVLLCGTGLPVGPRRPGYSSSRRQVRTQSD